MLYKNIDYLKIQLFLRSHNYLVSLFIIFLAFIFGYISANSSFFSKTSYNLVDKYSYFDNLNIYREDFYSIGSWWQLYTFGDKKFDISQVKDFVVISWSDLKKNMLPWDLVYFFNQVNSSESIVSFVVQKSWKQRFFISPVWARSSIQSILQDFFEKWDNRFELYMSKEELKKLSQENTTWNLFLNSIRLKYVDLLIKNWFTWFTIKPFSDNDLDVIRSGYYYQLQAITKKDNLDLLMENQIKNNFMWNELNINRWILFLPKAWLTWIYLFKSKSDLGKLWYQIVSFRDRVNNDLEYRRHNISTAFKNIWNVRILNSFDEISFMDNIDFDRKAKKNFKNWKVIVWDNIVNAYGGWVCGASTAIYQWIVTNKALEITSRIPHSKRVARLYKANINDQFNYIPWIDTTVYYEWADFIFRNISNHPIVLFLGYDWNEWSIEDVFSLWFKNDKWSLMYKKRFFRWSYSCYTWNINWSDVSSCYKMIQ